MIAVQTCAHHHTSLPPLIQPPTPERTYWDARFEHEALGHEWYRDYNSLRPVITRHLPRAAPLLQVGVGTSGLQSDMALRDGYRDILSVDYSPVAIDRLRAALAAQQSPATAALRAALRYEVADMRSMAGYSPGAFGGVLDKGALDALLCGDTAEGDAAAALGEVWRVLAPGAAYLVVTSGGWGCVSLISNPLSFACS